MGKGRMSVGLVCFSTSCWSGINFLILFEIFSCHLGQQAMHSFASPLPPSAPFCHFIVLIATVYIVVYNYYALHMSNHWKAFYRLQ